MREVGKPDEFVAHWPDARRLTLEVMESAMLTRRIRRIRLGSPALQSFSYHPGQDIMLWVSAGDGRMVYRRYTIRSLDRVSDSLDLEIFAHGKDGPAIRWASAAKPGDLVEAIGPRGKITLVPAGWYLFAGDEAFIPASFAMLEALPARTPAWAFLEVAGPEEEQPLSVSADLRLTWLHRGAAPPGDPAALAAAIKAASLPSEPGHAYVGAELQITAALRSALEARGFAGEHISSKAYWGRGRANASHGEPNRD